ncbi:hypothetical protein BD289DRAFT_179929 [Coniella lustricola]|uniref:Uncharacterized protein n=1 Tax=Coniella lustricola TaxID=2025994 RepID=A0A2T2ZTG4_9PEZI|nr:hypothetical protein BD289DRAFT_179929 [Coniella lustricola]
MLQFDTVRFLGVRLPTWLALGSREQSSYLHSGPISCRRRMTTKIESTTRQHLLHSILSRTAGTWRSGASRTATAPWSQHVPPLPGQVTTFQFVYHCQWLAAPLLSVQQPSLAFGLFPAAHDAQPCDRFLLCHKLQHNGLTQPPPLQDSTQKAVRDQHSVPRLRGSAPLVQHSKSPKERTRMSNVGLVATRRQYPSPNCRLQGRHTYPSLNLQIIWLGTLSPTELKHMRHKHSGKTLARFTLLVYDPKFRQRGSG